MKCEQAKNIKLDLVLNKLGYAPQKYLNSQNSIKYFSPFREEKTPSFDYSPLKNAWFDHGTGEGGNTLDFIIGFQKCSVSQALNFLENI
ncbi:CHC2 zinc finger domain-containing protein [Desulfotalea psychrophila]|uniref:Related to DNA primase PrmN1 (Partial length) n=1 Tax=Desulfotalea psychrophila (strain LSv54 / DSM 12343) TaxID=177439 RepID=Q6AI74_DESPS|nr:CHC2 zinc finger domain-containing protein [Desulfotalea psychrophila]CAG37855.1 related to DNA primase PrmN1 (partial length) [Desulfotalea psychrophila LSv54]